MRLGITLPILDAEDHLLDGTGVGAFASLAESIGFDSVWAVDSFHPGIWSPDPTEFLLAAAATTKHIELGILDFQLTARGPVEAAHELISLQALSNLRLIVAAGDATPADHSSLDTEFDTRTARLRENTMTVRRLANGDKVGKADLKTWPKVQHTLRAYCAW